MQSICTLANIFTQSARSNGCFDQSCNVMQVNYCLVQLWVHVQHHLHSISRYRCNNDSRCMDDRFRPGPCTNHHRIAGSLFLCAQLSQFFSCHKATEAFESGETQAPLTVRILILCCGICPHFHNTAQHLSLATPDCFT